MELAKRAAGEMDSSKLLALVSELNDAMEQQHLRRTGIAQEPTHEDRDRQN
jgi:hypothetical protein